jgi:hypothetical protein
MSSLDPFNYDYFEEKTSKNFEAISPQEWLKKGKT